MDLKYALPDLNKNHSKGLPFPKFHEIRPQLLEQSCSQVGELTPRHDVGMGSVKVGSLFNIRAYTDDSTLTTNRVSRQSRCIQ